MRGRFITFEGGEGVGKSTQAGLLARELGRRGLEVVLTREPGGTAGAEAIRALLLEHGGDGWSPAAEALLFAAARADHVERLIRPALQRGACVICDRFVDSSRAYQAGEGGLTDGDILALHRLATGGLLPDLTVFLETGPDAIALRLSRRDPVGGDRIGGREEAYHRAVAGRFAALMASEPERFVRIRGEGAPQEVHERILAMVVTALESTR